MLVYASTNVHMMTPNEIRAALLIKGVKVNDIAKSLNLSHSNVSVVISGGRPNHKVRQAIANAVGKSISDLWPEKQPQSNEAV